MTVTASTTRGIAATLAIVSALLVVGCVGSGKDPAAGSKPPDYATALAGSPAPLASLHNQADDLLPGGVPAFKERIAGLRSYPVVVNKWASWCGPCRIEFPFLQRQSARVGKRVAFIGVNSNDSDDAAKTFLGEAPLSYPSFSDPDSKIAHEMNAEVEFPATAFYDKRGKLVYVHRGVYASEDQLAADIKRYAL